MIQTTHTQITIATMSRNVLIFVIEIIVGKNIEKFRFAMSIMSATKITGDEGEQTKGQQYNKACLFFV